MTRVARPGEDGELHAGVRHDRGTVQEEFEGKRGKKLGGREQLEKRQDEYVFIAGRRGQLQRHAVGGGWLGAVTGQLNRKA